MLFIVAFAPGGAGIFPETNGLALPYRSLQFVISCPVRAPGAQLFLHSFLNHLPNSMDPTISEQDLDELLCIAVHCLLANLDVSLTFSMIQRRTLILGLPGNSPDAFPLNVVSLS
jgi:hypothetical protein